MPAAFDATVGVLALGRAELACLAQRFTSEALGLERRPWGHRRGAAGACGVCPTSRGSGRRLVLTDMRGRIETIWGLFARVVSVDVGSCPTRT